MSEITGTGHRASATAVVHESYSFACMRCGHGWEQSYEIEHHVDGEGHAYVTYLADGQRVPSPLSRPTCLRCGGHVVRIMRAGQVSSVQRLLRPPVKPPKEAGGEAAPPPEQRPHHHWRFSDLLHAFHRTPSK
ncbi:hypothetical protein [Streptomyces uncialis]|uniref:C2H2-type domain-containing protein n=1 Tax=Streptomyces uncialis TaxID=1048205 RepID=A0A1Q4VDP9_9ACTN|nr:hypothetical protein [Streptomyces uncialis]OKH95968.1 hypothetical protein AB852_04555 [Streptomyces uncialis]WTE12605.1 hypothetical protein OG924_21550 [Streptomyces uncialis]